MTTEDKIKNDLETRFEALREKITVKRSRRLFAEVPVELFPEVLKFSIESLDFTILATITGLDEGETFGILYHLARPQGEMLNLRIHIPRRNPVLDSIMPVFVSAEIYERELTDLFGIQVRNLPAGPRYPLPDGWPEGEYPLRKDWNPDAQKAGGEHA
jgi:membrane-bound hydrogenase subunit beta